PCGSTRQVADVGAANRTVNTAHKAGSRICRITAVEVSSRDVRCASPTVAAARGGGVAALDDRGLVHRHAQPPGDNVLNGPAGGARHRAGPDHHRYGALPVVRHGFAGLAAAVLMQLSL